MPALTVFIGEEDPDRFERLLRSLPQLGPFQVVGAPKGDANFARCQKLPPACAILDLRRPSQARQFVSTLRRAWSTALRPLIFLTARMEDRDLLASLASGADLVLIKPVLPSDLAPSMQKVLASACRCASRCLPLPERNAVFGGPG